MAKAKLYMDKNDISKVIDGIIENADVVAKTYGYSGHDICVRYNNRNMISNDGVFVSNNIFFEDELKDIGSAMVRGITLNSDLSSNDGTTAAAILTKDIMLGLKPYLLKNKFRSKSINMLDVKEGMNQAVKDIDWCLSSNKRDIDINDIKDLYNIALTATRDKELSNILSEAFLKIGAQGRVLYKEKDGDGIEVEYKTGFNLNYGYSTTLLPNVLNEPSILIYEERINSTEVMAKIIQEAILNNSKDLALFVKDGVADLVMQQLIQIQQSSQINININVIKMIGNDKKVKREIIDLSIISGAKILDNSSITGINADSFGKCKNINISEKQTTIVDGLKDDKLLKEHLDKLQTAFLNNRSETDKEEIQKRIANIKGLVAIIKIGGLSRERIENYKDKIKDAVGSMKNAIDKGVISGGGVALLDAYKTINNNRGDFYQTSNKNIKFGYDIVLQSLKSPINQILNNSYANSNLNRKYIFDNNRLGVGYNASLKEAIYDMFSEGIIDPYPTIINSLKNAIDLCSLFTNLEGFIITKSEVMSNE